MAQNACHAPVWSSNVRACGVSNAQRGRTLRFESSFCASPSALLNILQPAPQHNRKAYPDGEGVVKRLNPSRLSGCPLPFGSVLDGVAAEEIGGCAAGSARPP